MKRLTGFIAGVALLILAGGPASAQQCTQSPGEAEIAQSLKDMHGEIEIWRGVTPASLLRIFANPETGSWTLVAFIPAQRAVCFLADGNGSELHPAPRPVQDKGA